MRKTLWVTLAVVIALWLTATLASAEGPEYVGMNMCAQCHGAKAAMFRAQTLHPTMLRLPSPETVVGDFKAADPDLTFSLDEVAYVVGGAWKQNYLTEIEGELYVLPAQWNVRDREWVPYYVDEWKQRPYRRECAGCHTTGFDPKTGQWKDMGVTCEACHGPGGEHVATAGNPNKIVNPAKLEFKAQNEICGQCHSRGHDPSGEYAFPVDFHPGGPVRLTDAFNFTTDPADYWPDGSGKSHHMQYIDWQNSPHANGVGCTFCHVSHSAGEGGEHQTRMVGNHRCVICHDSKRDMGKHIPFMKDARGITCTSCHMPELSKQLATEYEIFSHTFWPPDPNKTIRYGGQDKMPLACLLCHTDKDAQWAAQILVEYDMAPTIETPGLPTPQEEGAAAPEPTVAPQPTAEAASGAPPPAAQPSPGNPLLIGGVILVVALVIVGVVMWRKGRA